MRQPAISVLIVLSLAAGVFAAVGRDIVIEGVYEASLDLPRIYFLLQTKPGGPALGQQAGGISPKMAFLDTGASGILLSKETVEEMAIVSDEKARFVDAGAGGEEIFHITQPLYLGLAAGGIEDPENRVRYEMFGQGRFQIKQTSIGLPGEAIDIIGMPVMLGRVVVLDSGATNSLGYFAAEIKKTNDTQIPAVDFGVALELKNCTNPSNPKNVAPLPVMTYNPFINGVEVVNHSRHSRGNWLFDTGATISFISTRQAAVLGLVDNNGNPTREPDFSVPIGGVGKMVKIAGFEIDELRLPTLSGNNLIFKKPRIGVHDVRYFDETKKDYVILDGVFGSNFLCASAKMEDLLPSDISETSFEHIVIDLKNKILGFDMPDAVKKP